MFTPGEQDVHLIAVAARHMGWMWEQDAADFSQVTLGLMRLQHIAHRLGYAYRSGLQAAGRVRRMVIGSAPGSQHLLGLSVSLCEQMTLLPGLFQKSGGAGAAGRRRIRGQRAHAPGSGRRRHVQ